MLVEDLLALPVGAHVSGRIETSITILGVIASLDDGSHFIRWDDGYVTIPLGKVREYDEYIASHTCADSGASRALHDEAEDSDEVFTACAGQHFARHI